MIKQGPERSVVTLTREDYTISNAIALGCVGVASVAYAVLCTTSLLGGTLWTVLLVFPLGYVMQFFFNALHYCTHDNFVSWRRANYVLGVAFGCITVMNFALYKPYHVQHHGHLFTDKDPEPTHRQIASRWQYVFEMIAPLFFLDNWVQSAKTMIKTGIPNIFGRAPPYLSDRDRRWVGINNLILALWLLVMGFLTVWFGIMVVWLYWAPLFVSFALANFVILPEHYQTDHEIGRNHVNSRTIKSGPLTRFFIVGLNYHGEHHLYPGVPFHNLPALNKRLAAEIKHKESSYIAFHWSLFKSLPWRTPVAGNTRSA